MHITSPEFIAAMKELEQLDAEFSVPSTTPGYESVWTPDGNIRMWSVPRQTGEFLYEYVLRHTPKSILELGTSSGYSAIWMAAAASTYGGHLYTIEMAGPKIALAQSYIDRLGLTEYITIVPGMAADVLASWKQPIDMLFLDADKMNYLSYMKLIEPMLQASASVVADNVLDFGHLMPDFLSYMKTSGSYTAEIISIDHGLLVATRVVN